MRRLFKREKLYRKDKCPLSQQIEKLGLRCVFNCVGENGSSASTTVNRTLLTNSTPVLEGFNYVK